MDSVRASQKSGFDPARLGRIKTWMQRYVDGGLIPGAATLIARGGQLVYFDSAGYRDAEGHKPWQRDTIARLYSMTKPVTAIGLMMLFEEALIHLDDPLETFLPEFKNRQVLVPGAKSFADTAPAVTPITIRHLLTHTSGLSYGIQTGLLGEAYARDGLGIKFNYGGLEKMVRRIAELPLDCEPGTRWHYSVSTDVIGRVIEVVSGKSFDRFIADRILRPLGMTETAFEVADSQIGRYASLYVAKPGGGMQLSEAAESAGQRQGKVDTFLGGCGLVGTINDYWRFAEMLRGGGIFKGERIIGPRTLQLMTTNHLPGEIAAMGPASWAETSFHGVGFGLLGSIILDPARAQASASIGDYGWGGMASTYFWVSPKDDLVAVYFTQLAPSSALPLRKEMRTLVHQALVG